MYYSILFPLAYISDQIMNSVRFQRFNRLAINTSDAPLTEVTPLAALNPPALHHFHPLMYVKLPVMALDYKECT